MSVASMHTNQTHVQNVRIVEKAHHHEINKDARFNVNFTALRNAGIEDISIQDILKKTESIACIVLRNKENPPIQGPEQRIFRNVTTLKDNLEAEFSGCILHPDENYQTEPVLAHGTAFFVGGPKNNLFLTAGHCAEAMKLANRKTYFIFDFYQGQESSYEFKDRILSVPSKNMFKLKKVVAYSDHPELGDWAIVKVKKTITGRKPLPINFAQVIRRTDRLYMLGHPKGLPMKFTNGVVSEESQQWYRANLDGFSGNSGSPVFNDQKVAGIFITGPEDYEIVEENGIRKIRGNFIPQGQYDEKCQRMNTLNFAKWYFNKDNPVNLTRLGSAYYDGKEGVQKDYRKAVKYFEQSNSHSHSLLMLGICYIMGHGKNINEKLGFQYLEKSIIAGNASTLELLKSWARQGKKYALYHLGRCYQHGYGGEKDIIRAFDCFRQAATQEQVDSYYSLGCCYENGLGTEKNDGEAIRYHLKAIENGHEDAAAFLYLGNCYQLGLGCIRNNNTAFSYFKRAADAGSKEGAYKTAQCYKDSTGVGYDKDRAIQYFETASDDLIDAEIAEWLWYNCQGEKAFKYLQLSYKKGDTSKLYKIALCYARGKVVPKDERKAFDCFNEIKSKKIRELDGSTWALSDVYYFLGKYYESGVEGIPKNRKSALYHYSVANDKGHPIAGVCYKELKQLESACTIM